MLRLTILAVAVAAAAWFGLKLCFPGSPPQLDQNAWWGPHETKGQSDTSIKPFEVKFSEEMIKDLRFRLKNHRPFAPPLQDVGFEYGFNSKQLDSWIKYWAEEYPFSERLKFFNKYPQFKTKIQGLDIHFIRVKPQVSSNVKVLPLLLLHGWPGSVREFYEAIPLLTKQAPGYDFAFEVIVPSMPGYGFSDPAVRPGLGPAEMAVIFKNLMNRLGLKKFYVQGGDAGAVIGSIMATMYQDDILGFHSNLLFLQQNNCAMLKTMIGAFIPSLIVEPHLYERMYPLSNFFAYLMEEFGYLHIQATKPDTVGVALTDSPSGLLAYILEKFSTWTRLEHRSTPDGALTFRFTKDQLIDNLMVYWSTSSITTSMRLYAETMNKSSLAKAWDAYVTSVPTWALQAKHELFYQPENILKLKYNLLGTTVLDDGGHFIAFELPQVFADDLFKAVKEFSMWNSNNGRTEL